MKRFTLHPGADRDLDGILLYLRSWPDEPAMRIGRDLRFAIEAIARWPRIGRRHEEYSELAHAEIRVFITGDYKIVYQADLQAPNLIAIFHCRQDFGASVAGRLR